MRRLKRRSEEDVRTSIRTIMLATSAPTVYTNYTDYDISTDGENFLMIFPEDWASYPPVLLDWPKLSMV